LQVASIKIWVESAPGVCNQRFKLKCDEPLSNVVFNVNVRRYFQATNYVRCGLYTLLAWCSLLNLFMVSYGRTVHVVSIKTCVESAYDVSA
jgi:hypothetical protein